MPENIKNIGILGGTFNPIHIGHLIIAQDAQEQLCLDCVRFVPCADPPHKDVNPVALAEHRLQMVQLAINDNPLFEVDDIEVRRGGKSFTVDTITAYNESEPEANFFFIIGSDSLLDLHLWKKIDQLTSMCTIVTVTRPGFEPELPRSEKISQATAQTLRSHILVGHTCEIASSEIRFRVAHNKSIRYLVPNAVVNYMKVHNLYRR